MSGDAVEAAFEAWLRRQISKDDYSKDIDQLVYVICRRMKEEKRNCGVKVHSRTWNSSARGLKANAQKGFETDWIKIDR